MIRALLLLLLAGAVHAATPEIGVAVQRLEPVACGFWYDCGRPHTFEFTKPAVLIGVVGEHWHADVVRSATFRSDAIAFSNVADARFVGHGWYGGITAIYDWNWFGAGALAYIPQWIEDTTQFGVHGHFRNVANVHVAPVIGLGHRWGRWRADLSGYFMCIDNRCKSEAYGPVWRNVYSLDVAVALH